jgi:hypothetical protein
MNWFRKIFKFFSKKDNSNDPYGVLVEINGELKMELNEDAESEFRKKYDLNMDPREWMARNGHNILAGDARMNIYKDKELEDWVNKAFTALEEEGLEELWSEFLTIEEIKENRDARDNW